MSPRRLVAKEDEEGKHPAELVLVHLAAKPRVAHEEYRRVEEFMRGLRGDGVPYDDFCITSLLYTNIIAKPKQRARPRRPSASLRATLPLSFRIPC